LCREAQWHADGGLVDRQNVGAGVTVIAASPLRPATVAAIVALPAATAETSPLLETEARVGSLLLRLTA